MYLAESKYRYPYKDLSYMHNCFCYEHMQLESAERVTDQTGPLMSGPTKPTGSKVT